MKANELRIGNWANRGWYGNDETKDDKITAKDLVEFDAWKFKPIPLTEEWLERFGFEKEKAGKTLRKQHYKWQLDLGDNMGIYYLIEVPEYWEHRENGWMIYQDIDYYIKHDDGYKEASHSLGRDIKYVNQLQNLFFALTGEELEIK